MYRSIIDHRQREIIQKLSIQDGQIWIDNLDGVRGSIHGSITVIDPDLDRSTILSGFGSIMDRPRKDLKFRSIIDPLSIHYRPIPTDQKRIHYRYIIDPQEVHYRYNISPLSIQEDEYYRSNIDPQRGFLARTVVHYRYIIDTLSIDYR